MRVRQIFSANVDRHMAPGSSVCNLQLNARKTAGRHQMPRLAEIPAQSDLDLPIASPDQDRRPIGEIAKKTEPMTVTSAEENAESAINNGPEQLVLNSGY